MIDNNYITEALKAQFGDKIRAAEESYGMLDIVVTKDSAYDIILWMKNDGQLQFNFLTSLCGMNYPERKNEEMSVVYHLHSFSNNIRLRLHALFSDKEPRIKTITDIFAAANWMERETFDFFGIRFEGHPDMRRILNVEDMTYFPLLKKYPLEDATRTDKEDKYFGR